MVEVNINEINEQSEIENEVIDALNDFENTINRSNNTPVSNMKDLEDIVEEIIGTIPKIDRNSLRIEMGNMTVPTFDAPTTFDINKGLSIAQGYRDRLTTIYTQALQEYKIRKRCHEMLLDATNLISKASSADKRKGEATLRYPILTIHLEAADLFLKEVESVLANMRSISETISRQGSIISTQATLGEYRKKLPDDFRNDGISNSDTDYHSGAPKINEDWC